MDASVLGLKIVRIKEGYQDLLEINGDPSWTKKVWDIRRDLPAGTNTEEGKTVLLLSGVESGTILTIAACIEGRQNDCISAWIFVPANLEISGKQLVDVIEETRKELMANERNDVKLHQLFDKGYPVNNALRTSIVSSGEQFAYRKYGRGSGYELYELLANPDQADYRHYKGIFLIDSSSGITSSGADISNQQLKEFVRIDAIPPVHGFQPFINNHSLTAPISLPEGDEISIVWKRNGYKTIEKKWIVRRGETVPKISDPDYKVLVPFDIFLVKDKATSKPIQDYTIKINNVYLEEGRSLAVHESAVRNCPVSIDARGYSISSKVYDLTQNRIVVYLDREKYTYDLKVELQYDDNRYADLHLETDVKLNGRSPIAGYRRDPHNDDYLLYNPFGKKQKLLALLVLLTTLLLGLVGGILLSNAINKNNNKGPEIITTYGTVGEPSKPDAKIDDAKNTGVEINSVIDYLDSHEKWNRTAMENYKVIQGLWDALNERRFDDIEKFEPKLNGSKKFMELIEAIRDNKHKTFQHNFNSDASDYDITIGSKDIPRSYIKKLYDAQGPSSTKPATQDSRESVAGKQTSVNQDEF